MTLVTYKFFVKKMFFNRRRLLYLRWNLINYIVACQHNLHERPAFWKVMYPITYITESVINRIVEKTTLYIYLVWYSVMQFHYVSHYKYPINPQRNMYWRTDIRQPTRFSSGTRAPSASYTKTVLYNYTMSHLLHPKCEMTERSDQVKRTIKSDRKKSI